MPKRIAITNINARTIDILNTIRANAGYEYQQNVPEVRQEQDIPKVGESFRGYPSLANQFINALVNRIALVRVKSATFNNKFAPLKKGYLGYGETIEEVYVNISKAVEFSAEKAEKREFKRTIPDVRTAFHTINWRVMYPITIQQADLDRAFTSYNGVQDLISRIIDAVFTAAEYDEYLLFKYLLIKAISHGKVYPVAVDMSDIKNSAKAFRGFSNSLEFMSTKYNEEGVTTTTPKADQYIFMDAMFNAEYDVDVLASAFNMGKADFMGRLTLIDDWTSFDNERFDIIRENSTMLEEVTEEELALMKDVKAVLVDAEWFQVYDNLSQMEETKVGSGLYWNYWYHNWKTVSSSPFANCIVFVDDSAETELKSTYTGTVTQVSKSDIATIVTVVLDDDVTLVNKQYNFVQTEEATTNGIAVHKYGAIIFPDGQTTYNATVMIGGTPFTGVINSTAEVGTKVTFSG